MGIETRRAGDEFPGGVPAEIILPLLTKSMAEISAGGFFDDPIEAAEVRDASVMFIFAASKSPVERCVRSAHFRGAKAVPGNSVLVFPHVVRHKDCSV